jgi:hypothetical protein
MEIRDDACLAFYTGTDLARPDTFLDPFYVLDAQLLAVSKVRPLVFIKANPFGSRAGREGGSRKKYKPTK